MTSTDPDHFYVGPGYHDPLDPREDYPTQESEDLEVERRSLQRVRRLAMERTVDSLPIDSWDGA